MKCLISNNFLDTIPRDKKVQARKKTDEFIKEMKSNNYDYTKLSKGYKVKKFRSTNKDIFAFRLNQGDRIIFTYSRELDNFRMDGEYILIFQYSSHDNQSRLAKTLSNNQSNYSEEDFYKEDEKYIKENEKAFNFDIEKSKTIIYPDKEEFDGLDYDLENVIKNANIYQYLNNVQEEIFQKEGPLLIGGAAGSGKTILGLKKLKSYKDLNRLYLTYTAQLRKSAEDKMGDNKIDFWVINDYFINKLNLKTTSFIEFKQFKNWYDNERDKIYKNHDKLDVWGEIRGIIKGYLLVDAKRVNNLEPLIKEIEYINLKKKDLKKKEFEENNIKEIYKIAEKYHKYLEENNLFDENDLAYKIINYKKSFNVEYIVLDELQDLSELQIYACTKLVNDKNNIFFSGDNHQIINPTKFDFGRIRNVFKSIEELNEIKYKYLNFNYRQGELIVKYINSIKEKRTELLGKKKQITEIAEESFSSNEGNVKIVENNKTNLDELIDILLTNPYMIMICNSDNEKKKLEENNKEISSQLFTINEIKGLEDKYVVIYNILDSNKKYFKDIINSNGKGSAKHRIIFNLFYVSITRATNTLVIFDDSYKDFNAFLSNDNEIQLIKEVDIGELDMQEDFTDEDWYNQAKKRENAEYYKRAKSFYEKAGIKDYKKRMQACDIQELAELGNPEDFKYIAEELFKIDEYERASVFFKKTDNNIKYVECMILCENDWEDIESKIKQYNINFYNLINSDNKIVKEFIINKKIEDLEYLNIKMEDVVNGYE